MLTPTKVLSSTNRDGQYARVVGFVHADTLSPSTPWTKTMAVAFDGSRLMNLEFSATVARELAKRRTANVTTRKPPLATMLPRRIVYVVRMMCRIVTQKTQRDNQAVALSVWRERRRDCLFTAASRHLPSGSG